MTAVRKGGAAAHWALFMLFAANVFNAADRSLLGVVTEQVRNELALSDTEMSLANGFLFVVFNLVGGMFIARLVDRGNRKRILAIGLAVWSLATAATGLAHDFLTLSLARIMVGIGEATAFPAAMSMIPDLYHPNARARAVAAFQSSSFFGIVGGTVLAGVLAAAFGWRVMFSICGAAGVALAVVLLVTVREPLRETTDEEGGPRLPFFADLAAGYRRFFAVEGLPALALAFGVAAMMVSVLGAWGPTFLQRSHGVPLAQVGLVIGPAVGLGGIAGTLLSGYLGDLLIKRHGYAEAALRVPLIALPLSLPGMAGFVFFPQLGWAMASAAAMNLLISASLTSCVHYSVSRSAPGDRGLTAMIMLASSGLIGAGFGPFIVGVLSDFLGQTLGDEGLRYALSSMILTPLISFAALLVSVRSARRS